MSLLIPLQDLPLTSSDEPSHVLDMSCPCRPIVTMYTNANGVIRGIALTHVAWEERSTDMADEAER